MKETIKKTQRDTDFLREVGESRPFQENALWGNSKLQALYQIASDDKRSKNSTLADLKAEDAARSRRQPANTFHIDDIADRIDRVIITIREDEFLALLQRFKNPVTVVGGRNFYQYCEYTAAGETRSVAIARCYDQGEGVAQSVATKVIQDLSPDWIFLVGIAGCTPYHEYFLGDVAVSNWLQDFSISAAFEGGKVSLDTRGGGMHHEVNSLIGGLPGIARNFEKWHTKKFLTASKPLEQVPVAVDDARLYGSAIWRQGVADIINSNYPLHRKRPRPPKIYIGQNASSDTLVLDTGLVDEWRKAAKNISTIEMELAGVYRAVASENPNTKLLGIRGISDVVGYKRHPDWTSFACHSAASFTSALLKSGFC